MTDKIKEYIESGNLSCVFAILYGQIMATATVISKLCHICNDLQKPSAEIEVFFDDEVSQKAQIPKRGRPRKTDTKN